MRYFAASLTLMLTLTLPVQAHTQEELRQWQQDWAEKVVDQGGMTPTLLAQYVDMMERHAPKPQAESLVLGPRTFIPAVENWRSLVQAHFGPYTNDALAVMQCESMGDKHAKNPTSTASGLFQFLRSTWKAVTGESDHNGVFDGAYNIAAAWKLSKGGTDWSHWVCKP